MSIQELVEDMAVVVRDRDGSFHLDRERFPYVANLAGCTLVGFLAGLVVLAPLAGAAIGALVGGAVDAIATRVGITEGFIREVEGLMRPGTSALFVLEVAGDDDVMMRTLRGLGGTVLRTNVDPEQARLIQTTLAADDETKGRSAQWCGSRSS